MRTIGRSLLTLSLASWTALDSHGATACESLASLDLGHTEIVSAAHVAAGELRFEAEGPFAASLTATNAQLAAAPAFCRITAVARPTADSRIGIEVWLPAENWNGTLQSVGNGAWAGSISYRALAEAQRYPDDYDGIVAGAAANYPSHLQGMQVWTAAVTNRQPGPRIGEAEFALVNRAVTGRFDAVAALDRWLQTDEPPGKIEAARIDEGVVVRTRPLCPYPSTAVYDGSGSTDASENFQCRQ